MAFEKKGAAICGLIGVCAGVGGAYALPPGAGWWVRAMVALTIAGVMTALGGWGVPTWDP